MTVPTKALTLIQPWASLIAFGEKKLETRPWWTSFRGTIAIHAGKSKPDWAEHLLVEEPFRSVLERHSNLELVHQGGGLFPTASLPYGAIVCVANLVNIVKVGGNWKEKLGSLLTPHELSFGDYTEGRFVWVLDQIQPIEPIPARGALSLWDIENDLQILLGKQLQEANFKRSKMQDPLQRGKGFSPDRVSG